MTRTSKHALAIALAGVLAACGGGNGNEANQTATGAEDMNMAAEAAKPFADVEKRMSEAMMSAVGSDVGQNWARKMIAHHQGAVDMSKVVLEQNPKPDVAEMARMTVEKQGKEISDLQKLLTEGTPDQRSADLYRPAMMDMDAKMRAASGADISETYLRKMLEHHKGAVAMSDVALQNGVSGAMRHQVQKTRDDQQKEVEMVEAMLRGEPMDHAMHESGAKSAEQAKAEPAVAERPKAAAATKPKSPPPAPKPAPKAATAETKPAPATSTSSCSPEHHAMGHC